MNKAQKELTARELKKEKEIINKLKETYAKAELELEDKIKLLEADELTQSKIYQLEYQKALKGQIGAILDNMNANNYTTIHDYLKNCYEDGFIGTMYDLQSQGIPMIMPIDQDLVVKAIQIDSKISEGLYTKMGVDTKDLKKAITQEVSRSISNNYTYQETARNLSNQMRIGFNKAVRIARTEGHRIVQQSRMDGMHSAKNEGANIVKQWDSTLDRKTRPHHQQLDGQIRELDEPFEVNGKKGMYPGGFNVAAEDINCRCVVLQRAKWALDEDELEEIKKRAEYYELDKSKDFEDFKQKYLSASKQVNYQEMTVDEYKAWRKEHVTREQLLKDFIKDYEEYLPEGAGERMLQSYRTGYSFFKEVEWIRVDKEKRWLEDILSKDYLGKESGAIYEYVQKADKSKLINKYWREGGTNESSKIKNWVTKQVEENWRGRKNRKKMDMWIDNDFKTIKEGSESLDFLTKYGVIDKDIVCERWAGADALKHLGIEIGEQKLKRVGHAFCSDGIDLENINEQLQSLKGAIITDNGYMSVSATSELNVFRGSDIKYKILVPEGATAYISNNEDESELIFPRGSRLEIIETKIIDTEAVDEWTEMKEKRKSIEIIAKLVMG